MSTVKAEEEEEVIHTLDLNSKEEEVDSPSSSSSVNEEDVNMTEGSSATADVVVKKTRKRKRKLCEECGEKEAAERKKQRNFKWTDKNKPAFEKCQKTRVLKQAVETAKKLLGQLLVEQITATDDEVKLALVKQVASATLSLAEAEQALADFKTQTSSPPPASPAVISE